MPVPRSNWSDLIAANIACATPSPPCATGPSPYSFVLIDCPPSLGLLTLNGLVAADAVLVPLQCEFYALEGISGLVRTIEMVKRGLNPDLRLQGIVLTMFDRRNNLSDLVAADARGFFGDDGLRNRHPPQHPHLRGAKPRQAGAAVRFPLARRAGLCAAWPAKCCAANAAQP